MTSRAVRARRRSRGVVVVEIIVGGGAVVADARRFARAARPERRERGAGGDAGDGHRELDFGRGARDAMSSATVGTTAASSSARARRRGNVYDVLGLITDRATRAIDRRRAGLTLRTDVGLDDVTARELGLDLAQSFRRERERRSVVESAVGGVQGVGWGHHLVSEG